MKNSTKLMITILILFLLTIGLAYAYFYIEVNGNSNDVKASAGRLSLNYTDGPEIIANGIHPGWSITKEVSVENTGTYGVYYSINWINLVNELINDEMVVRATCVDTIGVETTDCTGVDTTPIYSEEIISNTYIDVGHTQTYQITIEFIETSSEQNYNQGKQFSATINIAEDSEIITLNGILQNENGEGIEGATVEVHSDPKYAITDELGAYEIRGVEIGNHNLYVYDSSSNLIGNTQIEIQTTNDTSEIIDNKILINKEESVTQKLVTKVNTGNSTISLDNIVALPSVTYDMNISGQSTNITGAPQSWNKYGNLVTPSEEGYIFLGWYTSPVGGTKIESNTTLVSLSSHTLYAHWRSESGYLYKVRHFQMNLSGSYPTTPTEEEEFSGENGASITPTVKTYPGFTSPQTQTTTILEDGSRIVNYYYTRNQYTLTLVAGSNTSSVTGSGTYYYGESVDIFSVVNGTYVFHKWQPSDTTTISYIANKNVQTIIMGRESITLTASAVPSSYAYDYTGDYQTFVAPLTGYYQLEVWGAQGGYGYSTTSRGGYGAYSTGVVELAANSTIYLYVGGKGATSTSITAGKVGAGGYNGGGSGYSTGFKYGSGGGGATHIATTTGLLSTLSDNQSAILIVAGGGGSGFVHSTSSHNTTGSSAGGFTGSGPNPGTQSSGPGGFGQGQNNTTGGSGGGAGFYGGAKCGDDVSCSAGSGYIANELLITHGTVTKMMYCYNCTTSAVQSTLTYTTTNTSSTATANYGKTGNGYAKVTFVGVQ